MPADMSPKGIKAALVLIVLTLMYLILIGFIDYWFSATGGSEDYTMTYGLRYIYFHVPLAAATIIFGAGMIIGALFTHLAQKLYFDD